jgi:CubicO group peptidase (beta-lactamase class C family)
LKLRLSTYLLGCSLLLTAWFPSILMTSCGERNSKGIFIEPQAQIDSAANGNYVSSFDGNLAPSAKSNLVDSFFTSIYHKNGFNGVVLVADSGKVIYNRSFGYTDFASKDTLNTFSLFQLTSVSKQFTSMAIMMLFEEGKLKYDDPVSKYIKGFPYQDITIRLLLSHRSGLPNYMYFCEEYYQDKQKSIDNKKLIELLVQHKPDLYFEPDKKFNYCNTNYCVLASIVETVAEVPFKDFLEKRIFQPLGMKNTYVGIDSKIKGSKQLTTGYDENDLKATPDYLDGLMGDKGVYSCVNDLFIWDRSLYTESLVSAKTLQQAMKPANNDMIGSRNYGYGWRIKFLEDNTPVYYHGGWWKGYNTYYMRNPKDQSAIIILSNRVNGSFNNITAFIPVFYNQKKTSGPETI